MGGCAGPPQTCSVLVLEAREAEATLPLVGRLFAVKFSINGARDGDDSALSLYHAELFGDLLEMPAELGLPQDTVPPYTFDTVSSNRCSQYPGRFYLEELR